MNAEQAKIKNIIDIAWDFSAMTRVFKSGSSIDIKIKLAEVLPEIASAKNEQDFKELHNKFCLWFAQSVKTAERQNKNGTIKPSMPASYGQGAKVFDVALTVYVYYCHLPEPETAKRTEKWLNAAIDTKMMKYLKETYPEASIKATSIEDVDVKTHATLQKLVRKDIKNKDRFPGIIYPVHWDNIMWRKLNQKESDLKFKFMVRPFGVNPSAIDITCYDKSCRSHFPLPSKPFKLIINNIGYTTSLRNLKSGWAQIAKTYEPSGIRLNRADLCKRYGLHTGQTVYIEVVTPQKIYRLIGT